MLKIVFCFVFKDTFGLFEKAQMRNACTYAHTHMHTYILPAAVLSTFIGPGRLSPLLIPGGHSEEDY